MNDLPPNKKVSRIPTFTTQSLCLSRSSGDCIKIGEKWEKNANFLSVVIDVIIYVDSPAESIKWLLELMKINK